MKRLATTALTLCFLLTGCDDPTNDPTPGPSVFTASNTATAKVEGMTCAACEGKVCSVIKDVQGIEEVTADAATGEVKIAIKEGATPDLEAVKKAVTDAGFKVDNIKLPEVPKEDATQDDDTQTDDDKA